MTPQHEHVDLREYVDMRIDAVQQMLEAHRMDADKRFETFNEFRETLADQQHTLLSRNEYNQAHQVLVEKIEALAARLDLIQGSSRGVAAGWGMFAAILGVVISVITVLVLLFHTRTGSP